MYKMAFDGGGHTLTVNPYVFSRKDENKLVCLLKKYLFDITCVSELEICSFSFTAVVYIVWSMSLI